MRLHFSVTALVFITLAGYSTSLFAQKAAWEPGPGHITLPLWPHAPSNAPAEVDATTAKDNLVAGKPVIRLANVSNPTITLYQPSGKNSGAAVIVFPGGAYRILAIDLEGTEVCDWLTSIGVTCVLLKYRVPDSGPLPKSSAALEDAQRAVGMVRAHAAEWHIDPQRVGVLGFSAGAHLAAALSTHFEDDPVHVENSTVYFLALKAAKVPAEMHLYAEGGHGYGLRRTELPVTAWPQLVETWMRTVHALERSGS
jgi:acetyl esterase/lipase